MKKLSLFLIAGLFVLTACGKTNTSTESSSSNNQEEVGVTLVQGENTNQSEEVTKYVEGILKDNPNLGAEDAISLNYADATNSDGTTTYALFLVTNRTDDTINQNFEFTVNWSYDGTVIYENQKVLYDPTECGILEPNTTAIIFIPLPDGTVETVANMTDNSKVVLTMSDLAYVG